MDLQDRVTYLREASRVERVHTMPHHGTYSVGQHSYDMLCLLLLLHQDPSARLIRAVIWHDVPERWLGDMPAPAKWSDGELSKIYSRAEDRVVRALGIGEDLTAEENLWLSAIDKLECLLWAKEQLAMGNTNAATIVGNLVAWFNQATIPVQVQRFIEQHQQRRMPDVLP